MSETESGAEAAERKTLDVLDPTQMLGFILMDAGRLYARRFQERSRDVALDLTRCRALLTLAENEGVMQQRLAELNGIDPAAMGRILDRLEADGWAERRRRPGDRRARSIAITQAARELVPLIRSLATQSQLEALAGLTVRETQALAKALSRILANLNSYRFDGRIPSPPQLREAS